MTSPVGDVCGCMAMDFSSIPIPMLITQVKTIWLFFLSFFFCPAFLYKLFLVLFFSNPTILTYLPPYPLLWTNTLTTLPYVLSYWSTPICMLTYLLKRTTKVVTSQMTKERFQYAWDSYLLEPLHLFIHKVVMSPVIGENIAYSLPIPPTLSNEALLLPPWWKYMN